MNIIRSVLNLWGLIYYAVSSLLRLFRRVGVVGDVVDLVDVDEQIVPKREPIKIYPSVRGFSKSDKAKAEKHLEAFHESVKDRIWAIEDNNKRFGVNIKPTLTGNGLFNGGDDVPKNTALFVYVAAISLEGQQGRDKDASYLYYYWLFMLYVCFFGRQVHSGR